MLCDPLEMPLTDSAVDLIIAVHAFEHITDAEELMRELWRVAAPNARLIVVVPRRRGPWAATDNTPFGDGNPFSRTQLDKAAAGAQLRARALARGAVPAALEQQAGAEGGAVLRAIPRGCSGRLCGGGDRGGGQEGTVPGRAAPEAARTAACACRG